MNWSGIFLGLWLLITIGVGFLWVIKLEFYLGAGLWKWVGLVGLLICVSSAFISSFYLSAAVGIFGGSVVWGATELPAQAERVRRGLFPSNPKRGKPG